jgi:tetratricopeptide (TPR) repeat protein
MSEHHGTATESPEMISLMGYSLAKESCQFNEGIALCEKAISLNPHQAEHYLNLGRIYLLANKRDRAIKTFKFGLRVRKDPRIIHELKSMGVRKPPVLSSLSRDHKLNIVAGKLLRMLKLR